MNSDLIGTITNNTELTTDIETDTIEGELNAEVIDYALAANKPSINNVTLSGNKSLTELGIEIPTKVSDLQNDSGYITSYTETDPVFSASVASGITAEDIRKWNNQSGGTGDYSDLTNKPSINNITLSGNKSLNDLGIQPAGDYALISDIPTVPTNVSAFTNDAGYLTNHQDISGKLDTSKVKTTTSTTSGDVYDVTYINNTLGDIESLLGGI